MQCQRKFVIILKGHIDRLHCSRSLTVASMHPEKCKKHDQVHWPTILVIFGHLGTFLYG